MNNCIICGIQTKNKKFCSRKCKTISQTYEKKKCIVCNKILTRCDTKYCSKECYLKYKKEEYEKSLKYNNCIICGKKTLNEKYCSMKCLGKDTSRHETAIKNLKNEHIWSQEEIHFLEENYGKININDIEKILNINKNNIIAYCSKHNIVSQKKWTNDEKKFILENNDKDIEYLSERLNKSKSSILSQYSKLNGFSDNEGKSLISPQKYVLDFIVNKYNFPIINELPIGKFTTDILIYNLDIEVQGTYWHNDIRFIEEDKCNRRERDQKKKEFLESKNIEVFYIWEYDLYSNPEKIKKELENKIDSYLKTLTNEEKQDILNKNKKFLLEEHEKQLKKIEAIKNTINKTEQNLKNLGWPN